jgi:Protein of unknown function (DUF3892)
MGFFKGTVINHSEIELLVLETDTGPALAHKLGPKEKSPEGLDADAFRRKDGKAILGHKSWWKLPSISTTNIYQVGKDILLPLSLLRPVGDLHFGKYKTENSSSWGTKLTYVQKIIRNKDRKVVAYLIDGELEISLKKAISMSQKGQLDNVVVVSGRNGESFLRTKSNVTSLKNLT